MKFVLPEFARILRRNSLLLLGTRASTLILGIIFMAVTARRLTVADFGQFTWIAAIVLIGNTFTTFGTDTLLIRETAQAGHVTSLATQAFTLQLILSCAWWLAAFFLHVKTPLLVYSLSLFPLAYISIASALLRAFERMDLFWALNLLNGITQLIGAIFARDLYTLCILLTIGNLVTACLSGWICNASLQNLRLSPLTDPRPLFSLALPFALLMILSVLLQRLGVLTVSRLAGDIATGLFSAATRILEGLKLVHYAVLGALLPALSHRIKDSKQDYRIVLIGLLGVSILLAGAVTLFARPLTIFLFGRKYLQAVALLTVLVWSLIPYTISAFMSVDLVARRLEMVLVKATAMSLIVFIGLYYWLISVSGLSGAAYAALIGESIQAIILFRFRRSFQAEHETASST